MLVLSLSPVLALALVEAGLRWLHSRGRLQGWLYMSGERVTYEDAGTLGELLEAVDFPWKPFQRTGDFLLNSNGLRTGEYVEAKAPDTFRIVALGDSHTWRSGGIPFSGLWHSQLQARLATRSEKSIELINLGVPAVGPDFELRMWQLEAARLSPDLVVLAVSIGNDFTDAYGGLADETAADRLARRFLTFRLWRNYRRLRSAGGAVGSEPDDAPRQEIVIGRKRGGYVLEGAPNHYNRARPRFSVEAHRAIVGRRLVNTRREDAETFQAACDRVAQVIAQLDEDVRRHGARLALLLIPDEHQVDRRLLDEVLSARGETIGDYDLERPQRLLREACAGIGVLCVDPLARLQREGLERPVFHVRETHLNDIGHALLAEQLADELLDAGWIP